MIPNTALDLKEDHTFMNPLEDDTRFSCEELSIVMEDRRKMEGRGHEQPTEVDGVKVSTCINRSINKKIIKYLFKEEQLACVSAPRAGISFLFPNRFLSHHLPPSENEGDTELESSSVEL